MRLFLLPQKIIDGEKFTNEFMTKRGDLKADEVLKKWSEAEASKENH